MLSAQEGVDSLSQSLDNEFPPASDDEFADGRVFSRSRLRTASLREPIVFWTVVIVSSALCGGLFRLECQTAGSTGLECWPVEMDPP